MTPRTAGSAVTATVPGPVTLADADATCATIATRHYENFPVASWLVPAAIRPAVRSIYAFARCADDFADEPAFEGRRLELLDGWREALDEAFAGRARDPVFVALAAAIRKHALPRRPFDDLLAAFRRDAVTPRTASWDELIDYCRLSANPIGRIVLHLFGYRDEARAALSDQVCTGLQLANHWQDLAIDARRGRFYVPADLMRRHGVVEAALAEGRVDDRHRALMRDLIERTRAFFRAGRPLAGQVGGRLRYELRLTWLGGWRVLDRIEAVGFDVARRRPRLGAADAARVAAGAILWRG